MKHILFILSLLAGFSNSVSSQSLCARISVEVFPMNPQSGSYNYFGVRVTLDHAYSQNITVSGYIFDDGGGQNQNNPYSITITAGNLTNETSASFYQTDPTATAIINTPSITPSVVSAGGTYYSTACTQSVEDQLNTIGQLHNDFQESIFSYITANNIDISDTAALKSLIQSRANSFTQTNGFDNLTVACKWWLDASSLTYNASNYTSAGASILSSLNSLIANLNSTNESTFLSSLNSLKASALSLPNMNEVYSVGIPVTVAIYSYNYWTDKGEYWSDIINQQIDNRSLFASISKKDEYSSSLFSNSDALSSFIQKNTQIADYNLSESRRPEFNNRQINQPLNYFKFVPHKPQLIMADASGAISGAIGGLALGPGGAVALGLMEAGFASASNLVNQIMQKRYSWWPW